MFEFKEEDIMDDPLVSEKYEIKTIETDVGLLFSESFKNLIKPKEEGGLGFTHVRKMRLDGNTFYRSFLF